MDAQSIPAQARRVSVAPARLPRWLAGFAERHGEQVVGANNRDGGVAAAGHRVTATAQGDTILLHAADGVRAWIEVPFPPLPPRVDRPPWVDRPPPADQPDQVSPTESSAQLLAELVDQAQRRRRIGGLLVRRGGHAAGVFDGTQLLDSKVGSSYVQGTTKAGGWSQQRYARRRANQASAAFAHAADAAARVLLPAVSGLDALITGGDHAAIDAVLADPRLTSLRALRAGNWLAVPDPRLAVLRGAPELFLAVRIAIHP